MNNQFDREYWTTKFTVLNEKVPLEECNTSANKARQLVDESKEVNERGRPEGQAPDMLSGSKTAHLLNRLSSSSPLPSH